MSIRTHLYLTALGILILFISMLSWMLYQTRDANKILKAQTAELNPVSQAALAFHQHWMERSIAIDERLAGITSKDEAQQKADTTSDGLNRELKRLEKLLGALSADALRSDIKPQKPIRDLKNSYALALEADEKIFSAASPSATTPDIKTYLTTLADETANVQRITIELQAAQYQSSVVASTQIQRLMSWWAPMLIVVMILSVAITMINEKLLSRSFAALTKEIQTALTLGVPTQPGTPPTPGDPETASMPFSQLVSRLTDKIKSNDALLEQTITQKAQEIEKIKLGLQKVIEEQKRQYEEKITELSTLNKSMIGRELKMARLKQELHDLKQKLGDTTPESA